MGVFSSLLLFDPEKVEFVESCREQLFRYTSLSRAEMEEVMHDVDRVVVSLDIVRMREKFSAELLRFGIYGRSYSEKEYIIFCEVVTDMLMDLPVSFLGRSNRFLFGALGSLAIVVWGVVFGFGHALILKYLGNIPVQ